MYEINYKFLRTIYDDTVKIISLDDYKMFYVVACQINHQFSSQYLVKLRKSDMPNNFDAYCRRYPGLKCLSTSQILQLLDNEPSFNSGQIGMCDVKHVRIFLSPEEIKLMKFVI